jgi:hypothetical protein
VNKNEERYDGFYKQYSSTHYEQERHAASMLNGARKQPRAVERRRKKRAGGKRADNTSPDDPAAACPQEHPQSREKQQCLLVKPAGYSPQTETDERAAKNISCHRNLEAGNQPEMILS